MLAVVITLLQPAGPAYHFLCTRPLRCIGRISYGAYVLHDILHDLYVHVVVVLTPRFPWLATHRYSASATLGLAGTLLLSWLSFRFFESPFLNCKDRWTIRRAA